MTKKYRVCITHLMDGDLPTLCAVTYGSDRGVVIVDEGMSMPEAEELCDMANAWAEPRHPLLPSAMCPGDKKLFGVRS